MFSERVLVFADTLLPYTISQAVTLEYTAYPNVKLTETATETTTCLMDTVAFGYPTVVTGTFVHCSADCLPQFGAILSGEICDVDVQDRRAILRRSG